MKVVFADEQLAHAPKTYFGSGAVLDHPEVPERASRLLAAAEGAGLRHERPAEVALDIARKVHSERYLHFLEHIYPRWARIDVASEEVMPGIGPTRRDCGYPKSAAGQAGFHQIDLSSPINADTWQSVLWSAHTAVHAALLVIDGESACYALCRPPGHHAGRDYAAGFCYLANSAMAAEALRVRYARVAVLDVDVHHGNGTQEIFYERGDVLTVSIHADPIRFYPFFWGYADEVGAAEGSGANLNLPLPRGTDDDAYLPELDRAVEAIRDFGAGALVVALGLDAYEGDPFRGFAITTEGFASIGKRVGRLGLPSVLVQEGGYLSEALGVNLRAFLDGFQSGHGG